MTWAEMAQSSLNAARTVASEHPRASVSRSYYAAHVALTEQLLGLGYVPPKGRQTQPHLQQSKLIKENLTVDFRAKVIKHLVAAFSRLYTRRIDADYKRTVTIDRRTALDSLRDAASVLRLFQVGEI